MRIPRISLDTFIAVVVTAEQRCVMRAAAEIGRSPAAITKRIKAAERIAMRKLFHSSEDGLELTRHGRILYEESRKTMDHALLAEEKLEAFRKLESSHLLIGHSTYLSARLMTTLIQFHLNEASSVKIEHVPGLSSSIVQQVVEGTLHVGFGFLPLEHPDLTVRKLLEEPLVACIPASHPLSTRHTIHPEDLDGAPFIAVARTQMPVFHAEIEGFFLGFGVILNVVADAFAPPEALAYVEQKIGICLLAPSSVTARQGIVVRPLSSRALTRKSGLFLREDSDHVFIREFCEQIWKKTEALRHRPQAQVNPRR